MRFGRRHPQLSTVGDVLTLGKIDEVNQEKKSGDQHLDGAHSGVGPVKARHSSRKAQASRSVQSLGLGSDYQHRRRKCQHHGLDPDVATRDKAFSFPRKIERSESLHLFDFVD